MQFIEEEIHMAYTFWNDDQPHQWSGQINQDTILTKHSGDKLKIVNIQGGENVSE